MVLHIDVLGSRLAIDSLCENDTDFIIAMKCRSIYQICNSQPVKESTNLYTLLYYILQNNVFDFDGGGQDSPLLFATLRYYGFMNEEKMFYHRLPIFKIACIITVNILN